MTLLTAIAISAIAAYFSIAGLITLFSATPISIAIMGGCLEAAKLVTASWVYRNWTIAPVIIKYYLSGAVVILSLITSMGIFGFLSKSHISQATVAGSNTVELTILEQQEKAIKTRIDFILSQDQKMTYASNKLNRELQESQNQLKEILLKKAPLLQKKNTLESEIGPIKYVTEFIYGSSDDELLNKAVRWVILTLIFVFDPLAILLLIAANISLKNQKITIDPNNPSRFDKIKSFFSNDITINKENIYEIKDS